MNPNKPRKRDYLLNIKHIGKDNKKVIHITKPAYVEISSLVSGNMEYAVWTRFKCYSMVRSTSHLKWISSIKVDTLTSIQTDKIKTSQNIDVG